MTIDRTKALIDIQAVIKRAGDIDASILRRVHDELVTTQSVARGVESALSEAGLMPPGTPVDGAVRALLDASAAWERERESLLLNLRAGLSALRAQLEQEARDANLQRLQRDSAIAERNRLSVAKP